MENCQGLARSLLEAASLGADPPLNYPLPHTRIMLNSNKGEVPPVGLFENGDLTATGSGACNECSIVRFSLRLP